MSILLSSNTKVFSRSVPAQLKEIMSYLQSIQYVIGDLNEKVEELSTTQKEHIDKTMKELSNNQTRIRSINNKVVEIKQIIEPIKQDIESKWLGYLLRLTLLLVMQPPR